MVSGISSDELYKAILHFQKKQFGTMTGFIDTIGRDMPRLEYLTASFRQAGLNRSDAQHRARLAYAAYVGFLQLSLQLHQPRLQHDEFEAYVEHVMAALIPQA